MRMGGAQMGEELADDSRFQGNGAETSGGESWKIRD